MCDHRIVLCEHCGSEGRIYRGHANDPNPRDDGPCPVCEGTGYEVVTTEPITMEEALAMDAAYLRSMTGEDHWVRGDFEPPEQSDT